MIMYVFIDLQMLVCDRNDKRHKMMMFYLDNANAWRKCSSL